MNKLIEIKKTKKNRYLLIIKHDNKAEKHLVSENMLIKYNLLTPRTLSDHEYKIITKVKIEDLLYEKALNFIDYKMRTISEVKKRLKKETEDEELINKTIQRLKKDQYLNDNLYVETYLNEKIDYSLVGPAYLKEKLILKGIHYDLIDQHLLKFTEEDQYHKIAEIIKNETKYKIKKPYRKAYISLKRKLVNKGFSLKIIESALISNQAKIKAAIDEEPLIKKELAVLKKRYNLQNYEEKSKVIKALLNKGFDYELIKKSVKEGDTYDSF